MWKSLGRAGAARDIQRAFSSVKTEKTLSPRMKEFKEKLKQKPPFSGLGTQVYENPYQENDPLKPWPNGVNPYTGEIGGPSGPEPTRYGDWERKGRVSDF